VARVAETTAVDVARAIIEPRRGKREAELPPLGLLVFTPLDVTLCTQRFQQPHKLPHPLYLADLYTGRYESHPVVLAGPMLGAPQAVLILEKLIACGVRRVLAFGWCGSLQPHMPIGDILVPTAAVSDEGTSRHYPLPRGALRPDGRLLADVRAVMTREDCVHHSGTVWSMDAPYRETVGKVLHHQQQGVLGVDMETSALFAVAAYRTISLAAVLVVSDELHALTWHHGFRDPRLRTTRQRVVDILLVALVRSSQEANRKG
jgi:uridine phosphorylase